MFSDECHSIFVRLLRWSKASPILIKSSRSGCFIKDKNVS